MSKTASSLLEGLPGKLNFPLFLSIISETLKESEILSSKLQNAFEIIDEEGRGYIKSTLLEEASPGVSETVIISFNTQIECYGSHISYKQLLADNTIGLHSMENLSIKNK